MTLNLTHLNFLSSTISYCRFVVTSYQRYGESTTQSPASHTTATNISPYFVYEIDTENTAAAVYFLIFPHVAQYKVANLNISPELL